MRPRRSRPPLPESVQARRSLPGWKVLSAVFVAAAMIVLPRVIPTTTPGNGDSGDANTANAIEVDRARYHDKWFRVVHVADGDTFDIDAPDGDKPRTRIRLWGVDTPEMPRGDKPAMHFAEEANAFAREVLLNKNVRVVLSPTRTRGKYGRLLAYVYLEGEETAFNEMLIERGLGYADTRFPQHYMDRYESAERHARSEQRGLWKSITPAGMPKWRRRAEGRP